jgi:xanthine/CO dehydrogenase XdhC/CoxF family maturation factor
VRALDYRAAGFDGAASGTRVDVVTVEECAEGGSAEVRHQTWRLLNADGRILGAAGGKIVNGNPTEDLPQTLSAGQCLTTKLAIGVPAGSAPVAVQDGPDDTWLLTS